MEEDRTPNNPPHGSNKRTMRTRSTPRPTSASLETPGADSWASGVRNNNSVSSLSGRRPPLHTGGSVSSAPGSTPRRSARIASSNKRPPSPPSPSSTSSKKRKPSPYSSSPKKRAPSPSSSPSKKRKPSPSSSLSKKRPPSSSPSSRANKKKKAASGTPKEGDRQKALKAIRGSRITPSVAYCRKIRELRMKRPHQISHKSTETGNKIWLQKYTVPPFPPKVHTELGLSEDCSLLYEDKPVIPNDVVNHDDFVKDEVKKRLPLADILLENDGTKKDGDLELGVRTLVRLKLDLTSTNLGAFVREEIADRRAELEEIRNQAANAPAELQVEAQGTAGVAQSESERLAAVLCNGFQSVQEQFQRSQEHLQRCQEANQANLQILTQSSQETSAIVGTLATTVGTLTTTVKSQGQEIKSNAEDIKILKETATDHGDRLNDQASRLNDQASQLAILQDKFTTMSARKSWKGFQGRMNETVAMSSSRLFGDDEHFVSFESISTPKESNYLHTRLSNMMRTLKNDPEAFSEHHRKVLECRQEDIDLDYQEVFEKNDFYSLNEDVSSLNKVDGFKALYDQLNGGVIVLPTGNEQEEVYILSDKTDSYATEIFLYSAGGSSVEIHLTVNETTLYVYAPSVEAATPTCSALIKLAAKSRDATLEMECSWVESTKSDPIDLPLQAITIEHPLKKLVVQSFNLLSGQEATLMACAQDITFENCGKASDDVSNSLVREALKAKHLENMEFRYEPVLTPEATDALLAGLKERAQGPSPLVVEFKHAWGSMPPPVLDLLVGKVQHALERGESMSYMVMDYEDVLDASLKRALKTVVKDGLEKLGKDHQVAKKVLDEGWLPVTLKGSSAKKPKVQDLVKKWAAQVDASADEKGPAATIQGAARSPFTTSGEN